MLFRSKGIFPMWDSKPKKITSATLGLEAKIAPTINIKPERIISKKKKTI